MIKQKNLEYFSLLLYLIGISAFQLGSGFDAIFVRLSFVLMIAACILTKMKIQLTSHLKWCLLFWGLYYISMIWASNKVDTMYYVNNTVQIIGISICFSIIVKNKDDINIVLKLIAFSMLFTSIRLIIYTPISAWGTERIGEAIGQNSNGLGMRLAIAAVMSLYLLHKEIEEKNKQRKLTVILYSLMLILFSVLILFTGSKKSILVLVVGLSIYELMITKGWKFLLKVLLIVGGVLVLIYLIFNNEMLYTVLGRRIERTLLTLQGTATGFSIDRSLEERSYYRQMAKQLFFDYPILGYGGNNFMSYMREIGYSHVAYCHDNYFEILSTLGIVGFVLYYFEWVLVEVRLLKLYKYNKKDKVCLLLSVIIAIELVMDYGNVSYVSEFTQMILIMGFLVNRTYGNFRNQNTKKG